MCGEMVILTCVNSYAFGYGDFLAIQEADLRLNYKRPNILARPGMA